MKAKKTIALFLVMISLFSMIALGTGCGDEDNPPPHVDYHTSTKGGIWVENHEANTSGSHIRCIYLTKEQARVYYGLLLAERNAKVLGKANKRSMPGEYKGTNEDKIKEWFDFLGFSFDIASNFFDIIPAVGVGITIAKSSFAYTFNGLLDYDEIEERYGAMLDCQGTSDQPTEAKHGVCIVEIWTNAGQKKDFVSMKQWDSETLEGCSGRYGTWQDIAPASSGTGGTCSGGGSMTQMTR